jgi:hypothetical protein
MKRTLILLLLVASIVLAAIPASAGSDINTSAAMTRLEVTPPSGVYASIDAAHRGELVGSWTSNSAAAPCLIPGLTYMLYGWFPGIQKVDEVWFSSDSWKTRIKAVNVDKSWGAPLVLGKANATTYAVEKFMCPVDRRGNPIIKKGKWTKATEYNGLFLGANGLECYVKSHDKEIRFVIGPILFKTSGSRMTNSMNFIMVQYPPVGVDITSMSADQVFGYLTGFMEAQSRMDPAIAVENNIANTAAPQPQPQQTQTAPPPNPVPPAPQAAAPTPQPMRFAPVEPNIQTVTLVIGRGNERPREIAGVTLDLAQVKPDVMIEFRWKVDAQDMKAQALVESVDKGRVKVQIISGNWPAPGAGIWLGGN